MYRSLALVIVLAALASSTLAKEPRVKGDRLEFAMTDVAGDTVTSADPRFESNVLFVTIWGTWCPSCISEIPTFNDLKKRYADAGLVVVAIAFERPDDPAKRLAHLREFCEKRKVKYLVLDGGSVSDFSRALPMMDDVKGFPIEILIDRTGRVVACRNGYGYKKRWARRLEKELVELLEKSE